ncbi:hypothetical protein CI109_101842 [Kwoniella shandongensis]|uniref:Uncharacterized protein n=1 Tax=Kwoniella shandongensis TaxID=1734106 RepID=A0A5M6BRD3_9TREE|nr:uncharacterized protein CI109_007018 [Kwoniella shandongensis]KAA5524632.1 hypothetical protein CI109_007018 [Kwoniella shandongensis]
MTPSPFAAFNSHNAMASGSSFKAKRKRMSWGMDEEENTKHIRVRSPVLTHQHSFTLPELMTDHSNSASDDDQAMDQDMDMDGDMDMPRSSSPVGPRSPVERCVGSYMYESGGSGGFGFGPGAEEDEMEMMDDMGSSQMKSAYPDLPLYPSITPHPNPNHFSNKGFQSTLTAHPHSHTTNPNFAAASGRPTSPLAAQPFSTSLAAPGQQIRGILQPTASAPLPPNATEVDKARAQHGPWCKSIPRLVLSDYPDAATGQRSMWSICGDCGACERAE